MKIILLDTNIFDKLADDANTSALLHKLSDQGSIKLIASVTVRDELVNSPHIGLLKTLPIKLVGNTTPIPGIMRPGDYLGNAEHYFKHKGESQKVNDALIAAAAEFHADWLVSEDRRLRHRLQSFAELVKTLTYDEFLRSVYALNHPKFLGGQLV